MNSDHYEPDRNPSPPAELLEQRQNLLPDQVGDSVFSKQWLIQVLINIVESVNREEPNVALNSSTSMQTEASTSVLELDPKLEEDSCALWDMSANKDVAFFLHDFNISEMFVEAIEKTQSPRLVEIAVGILGNIASFDSICQDISKKEALLKQIINLCGSSDAPTIVQVLRLVLSGVVNEKAGSYWLQALRQDSAFMHNMKFILENSLNGDVLKGTLQLLYYILDKEDNACSEWASAEYTKALIDSGKQLHILNDFESVDELWLLLNLMCQYDENISAMAKYFDDIAEIFHKYITKVGDSEHACLPPVHRVAAIAASFTTLATLMKSDDVPNVFCSDDMFKSCLQNMLNTVTHVLDKGIIIEHEMEDCPSNNEIDSFQQSKPVCNGVSAVASDENKLSRSVSLHEDDYNSFFILKEAMVELCAVVFPSMLPQMDDEDG